MSESLLPLDTVIARVGFKRSKIYALIDAGKFPKPVKIGNASRWQESAVAAWVADCIAESNASAD